MENKRILWYYISMKNKEEIINKIGFSLLSIIIIFLSIIIGANDKPFRSISICIFLFLIIIFLTIKKIIKKNESIFIRNKIDVFCLLFMISTILPLLFKTYSSLSYEIEFIIKYFFYYAVYILTRNVVNDKKDIKEIFNVILISSFFPIVLGLDQTYFHRLDGVTDFFDLRYTYNYKIPFTFGYANTMAIFMSSCIFISLYQFENSNKKIIKILNLIYILIAFIIIYLTYSRFVLFLLLIFLLVYFYKKYKKFLTKYLKRIVIGSVIIIPIMIILTISLSKVSKPRYVEEEKYEHIFSYNFEKNKEYKIDLDIDFYSNEKIQKVYDKNSFNVKISSVNNFYNEQVIINNNYGNGHKNISLNIKTLKNTKNLRLYIYNRFNGSFKINKVFINDDEYIISYKYIPSRLGKMIKYLKIDDKSLNERKNFYNISLKIFKKHMLFGNGGNAWHSMSRAYENHKFFAKETHSYFFELLISFGLVGTILFSIFAILIMIHSLKNKNNLENKIITYALGIILLHSITFDFNMSFMFINVFVYVLCACSLYNYKNYNNYVITKNIDYGIMTILIIVLLLSSYAGLFDANIINKNNTYRFPITNKMVEFNLNNNQNMSSDDQIKYTKYLMNNEPYFYQNKVLNSYFLYIYKNLELLNDKDISDYLEYGLDRLTNVKPYAPQYIVTIIQRETILYNFINVLKNSNYVNKEEYIKKYTNIFLDEYEDNIKIIKNNDANGYDDKIINQILIKYEEMYNGVR